MRLLVEVSEETGELDDDGNPIIEKTECWLHHWALEYNIVGGQLVNYTCAICENRETGEIRTFMPVQLRVIGKEIKE